MLWGFFGNLIFLPLLLECCAVIILTTVNGIYYFPQYTTTPTIFFAAFRVPVMFLMLWVCFKPITLQWNAPCEGIFFRVASWLFHIMWCSFTTCLLFKTKANHGFFVCHRTVSMAAVYQLKIKYDQDKFRVFLDAKRPVSYTLEDKHVVNEHRIVRKSVVACCIKMYHVVGLKPTRCIKNVTLKAAKKFVGVMVHWEE